MNNVLRQIKIDLYSTTSYEVIKAQQGDKNSRIIEFILYNQGEPYKISDNVLFRFDGHRGDGSSFSKNEEQSCITRNGNHVSVTLPEDILYYAGVIEAKLVMYELDESRKSEQIGEELKESEKTVLSTIPFKISCIKNPCNENNLSEGEFSIVTDLVFQMEEFSKGAQGVIDQAADSASKAKTSEDNASSSAATATNKANEASTSATNAANSASTATTKANAASTSASDAATSASTANTYAKQAQSYALGTGNVRPNESIENAKYYYEQAKNISSSFHGALRPMGTVSFANLPSLADAEEGDMYNISDKFTTNANFKEGSGLVIPAGSNVYKTADDGNNDGKWDVLAGSPVTSVNGQTGDVSVTPENIGAVPLKTNGIEYSGKNGYIAYPSDGFLNSFEDTIRGYLRITLPVSWTNTMVKFTVSIFNYVTNKTTDYHISGYNYGNETWINCTAVCVGKAGDEHSNLTVRFGHDGEKCAITIGESTTSWRYPKVKVHDILLGQHNTTFSMWNSGWNIEVNASALPAVKETISNTHVASLATNANYMNVTNGNELLFGGYNGSNDKLFINYKLPDRSNAQTKMETYKFCNGRGSTSGVTLEAENFTGNAATATKATQDGDGNVIKDSYAVRKTVTGGDFNNMTTPGLYTMKSSTINAPTEEGYHSLIVLRSDTADYIQQIAVRESTTDVYVRYKQGTSWGNWVKLLTAAEIQDNLTSTSTTDSLSANQGYLLANGSARDNSKLPLTGGTLTDDLTINGRIQTVSKSDSSKYTVMQAGGIGLYLNEPYINFHQSNGNIINLKAHTTTGNNTLRVTGTNGGYFVVDGSIAANESYEVTTSNAANTRITNSNGIKGEIQRVSSSSKRYKTDITTSLDDVLNPDKLYDVDVVQYKYKDGYLSENDLRYGKNIIGLIAEDVKEKYPVAVEYEKDDNGSLRVEDWNYRFLIPAMLKLIQDQKKEIDVLKEKICR